MTYHVVSNELYHHGILGQKWGVRRFQNSDGTLTEAGKARYKKEFEKAEAKQRSKVDHKSHEVYKKNHENVLKVKRELNQKYVETSKEYAEYRKAWDRLEEFEDRVRSLSREEMNSFDFSPYNKLQKAVDVASEKYCRKEAEVFLQHIPEIVSAKLKDLKIDPDETSVAAYWDYVKEKHPTFEDSLNIRLIT